MNKDCDEFDMWCKNRLTKNDIYSAIFEGMTNGEVIMALFPNPDKIDGCFSFTEEWANAPYTGKER